MIDGLKAVPVTPRRAGRLLCEPRNPWAPCGPYVGSRGSAPLRWRASSQPEPPRSLQEGKPAQTQSEEADFKVIQAEQEEMGVGFRCLNPDEGEGFGVFLGDQYD